MKHKKYGYILLALLVLGGFSCYGEKALAFENVSIDRENVAGYDTLCAVSPTATSTAWSINVYSVATFNSASSTGMNGGQLFGGGNNDGGNRCLAQGVPNVISSLIALGNGTYYIVASVFVSPPQPVIWYGTFTVAGGTIVAGTIGQTKFIDPYTPANGAYASSTLTSFLAPYYFDCNASYGIYDYANIEMKDLTDGTLSFNTPAQPISICGQTFIQSNITTVINHQYLWRPVIYSSSSLATPIYGNFYSFLATSSPSYTPFTPFTGATVGTSTLPDVSNLLSFLNVPALIQTRIPFAYIFQIASGIYQGINSSSTGSIPSGNFVWHNTLNGTTTFDFFSQATIETYLSPTLISLWRAFLLVILTIDFGYALYRKSTAHKII